MDATYLLIVLGPIAGGVVLYAIISRLVKAPGRALQGKFVRLGMLKGKSKADILSVVGPPSSVTAAAGGGQLLQWLATGYHIALIFDANGICQGVTHEFRAR